MANTYTQIHIQYVFAVKFRAALIDPNWKSELHQYISGLLKSREHKPLQINSMPDHIHIFLGQRPDDSISSLARIIKSESSKWINDKNLTNQQFRWQSGFGAFSYSKSDVPRVIRYIANQEAHHKKQTFLDEYREFLEKFGVEFNDNYVFVEPT